MTDVTQILQSIDAGDVQAAKQLLPLVYHELRKLASAMMARERPDHTLDATALIHEAYLRLIGNEQFEGRRHFFAAAAEAMRRILVDHARERCALKRGGDRHRVPLSDFANSDTDERLLHLDQALARLATINPMAAKLVELHHFAGLPQSDTAAALGITEYQVRQEWAFARAWLKTELSNS